MSKNSPKKIDPDVIVTAIFQIRFRLSIPPNELLGYLYPILIAHFPKLEQKNQGVPQELIKLDPQLRYITNYAFSNSDFSVSFGNNALSFEYLSNYRGWDDFYLNLEKVLVKADDLNIFEGTDRIGLRYINVIDGNRSIKDVIDFKLDLDLSADLSEGKVIFKKEFTSTQSRIVLNITEDAVVRRLNIHKKGIMVDIDASMVKDLPKVGSQLLPLISKLHETEKFVFFNVLKQNFIDSLNPVY